jgi:hypothetical protein
MIQRKMNGKTRIVYLFPITVNKETFLIHDIRWITFAGCIFVSR